VKNQWPPQNPAAGLQRFVHTIPSSVQVCVADPCKQIAHQQKGVSIIIHSSNLAVPSTTARMPSIAPL
jgi:hypothetical protein